MPKGVMLTKGATAISQEEGTNHLVASTGAAASMQASDIILTI